MRYFQRKQKTRIAWWMVAALVVGILFAPMGTAEEAAAASVSRNNYGAKTVPTATAAVSLLPTVTTGGGVYTPAPTKTPVPTKTPMPVVTAKPSADILLGTTDTTVTIAVGKRGEFDIDRTAYSTCAWNQATEIGYASMDSDVLQVSGSGSYQAVGLGETSLTVEVRDANREILLQLSYSVQVTPDMTNVTLAKDAVTVYILRGDYSAESSVTIAIRGGDADVFDEDTNDALSYEITSSKDSMDLSYRITEGALEITCGSAGKTTLTIQLYGKEFKVHLTVVAVKMSKSSVLMARHTTTKLKVKGYSGKVTWKSSRPKVASVSAKGKIRGKKEGTTIISAKVGTVRMGCAVSVTTAKKKKVIRRAQRIARTSKYSQPLRMRKGYYDCSSLVWRAYSKYGYRFGISSYAPTAAGEASYLAARHRFLKGGLNRKNVTKMRIKAGDLYFETGAKNGRYKGIYHVEMIAGYEFVGWDSNNKPMVLIKWVNRSDGYYGYGGGLIGKM